MRHHRSRARAIRNPTPPTRFGARAATVECLKVPGCDTFGRKGEERDLLAVHPTVKPMANGRGDGQAPIREMRLAMFGDTPQNRYLGYHLLTL